MDQTSGIASSHTSLVGSLLPVLMPLLIPWHRCAYQTNTGFDPLQHMVLIYLVNRNSQAPHAWDRSMETHKKALFSSEIF